MCGVSVEVENVLRVGCVGPPGRKKGTPSAAVGEVGLVRRHPRTIRRDADGDAGGGEIGIVEPGGIVLETGGGSAEGDGVSEGVVDQPVVKHDSTL